MTQLVTFYTDDPPYPDAVERLRASCEKHGHDLYAENIRTTGSWSENCNAKSAFCLWAVREFGRILWVDADAEIMAPLPLAELIGYDFAVYEHPRYKFQSGTVLLDRRAVQLIHDWMARCNARKGVWDQVHLCDAWDAIKPKPRTLSLHQGWCKVFDQKWHDGEPVELIRHHQASRTSKRMGLAR